VSPSVPEGVAPPTTPLSNTTTPVTATIGGQTATVAFAGLAPGFPGLYQVNVVIPSGVAPGDNVPVVLTEGSQVSQPVTIAVR
jgi:adhesin/invasin